MNSEITSEDIWYKYEKDKDYKNRINLFEKVKQNENFMVGRQWEGVNAPDLPKPVFNIIKRIVNYLISVLVVDDIGIAFKDYNTQRDEKFKDILKKEIDRINENTQFKSSLRMHLRNAAVDGDTALYVRFNPDVERAFQKGVQGEIEVETVDNTNIHFGNIISNKIESQPYIIISKFEQTEVLKQRYSEKADDITADTDYDVLDDENNENITTVLMYFYKKNGTVHYIECTRDCILKEETDTELKRYPIAYLTWEPVKHSCHGVGVVEEVIPNQIEVNKLWAMALLYQKSNAFPKTFIDGTKVSSWDNSPNSVIRVIGNPNEAIATSFKASDMSNQIIQMVNQTISYTKEFMGANDAVLGNVNPQNTSALIQVQKASAAPLELQRLSLYKFIEDYVRILLEIIRTSYGHRSVYSDREKAVEIVDFSQIGVDEDIYIDIGAAAFWSETAQIQTMDNLFRSGIIQDAEIYVNSIPEKNLHNKNEILQHIKALKEQQQLLQQQAMHQGGTDNVQMQMQMQ